MTKYIKLSVPEHLCEKWDEEVEKYADSRSEFIRMMVEAGRKEFQAVESEVDESSELKEILLEIVASRDGTTPEEIIEILEDKVIEELESLDEDGDIKYSPQVGGYVKE
jgi:metal-responsive CopG/Arc/MetJ family transcriptional regulator